MATRKFGGIEYPIPGVDTAINTLYPGARWELENTTIITWEDPEGREPPLWEEIEAEIIREVNIYNYYLYERNREEQYPFLQDQLDMLYHDIKSGNLENGSWIASIDKVKQENPKPDAPPPTI